jgi:hypothetical protein
MTSGTPPRRVHPVVSPDVVGRRTRLVAITLQGAAVYYRKAYRTICIADSAVARWPYAVST